MIFHCKQIRQVSRNIQRYLWIWRNQSNILIINSHLYLYSKKYRINTQWLYEKVLPHEIDLFRWISRSYTYASISRIGWNLQQTWRMECFLNFLVVLVFMFHASSANMYKSILTYPHTHTRFRAEIHTYTYMHARIKRDDQCQCMLRNVITFCAKIWMILFV